MSARPVGGGTVEVVWRAGGAARRKPARASLLWPGLPVPSGAEARRLETGTADGWQWRETYGYPAGLVPTVAAWFREELRDSGWRFERLEPAGDGPAQVYAAGGEELLISFLDSPSAAVTLARRRVCAGDEPVPPPVEGRPAVHLAEMPVYPGAAYVDFQAPYERHLVRCAATGLVADWYRVLLERGDWALVSTEFPADPLRRQLIFARPEEKSLPPSARTAWASVRVERVWPYQHRLTLARDPTGVRSGPTRR
jgi:hypothetical protein